MAQFVNMFEVDLDKRSYPVCLDQTVSEGNVSSNRIGAYVYKDGAAVNLGGFCTGMVMRADGSTVPLAGVIDGNAAYVVLDQPSCAIPGPIQVSLNWVSGNNTTTLLVVYGTVIQTDTRDYVQPGTPIPDINTLLSAIEDMEEATAAAEAAATKSVRYDSAQSLTTDEETTARNNISAASDYAVSAIKCDLSYTDNAFLAYNDDVVSNSLCSYTDYAEIPAGCKAVIYTYMRALLRTLLYDEDKSIITAYDNTDAVYPDIGYAITITPSTAKRYVRISTYTEFKSSTFLAIEMPTSKLFASFNRRVQTGDLFLTDADDAELNRVYTITSTGVSHLPGAYPYGTLVTFDGSDALNGCMQMFVAYNGFIFTRIHWGGSGGTWLEWQQVSTGAVKNNLSGIEMFEKFGVIGDSFASGVIYTSQGETSDREHMALSWPQIIARMTGSNGINYTKGGINTQQFLTDTSIGMPKLLSDIQTNGACGLYILCLGINDSNVNRTPGGLSYLGRVTDIHDNDYTLNADTFYGNYGRIIQMIQEASPDSRIMMCNFRRNPTTATAEGYEPFRTAIVNIADHFGLPCIKLDDDSFFTSDFYMNNMVGSHPTAPQYVGYAKGMLRLISKEIADNYAYFKEYTGV